MCPCVLTVARRGKPADIYSDNGKNFVGANNKQLKELSEFLSLQSHHKAINNFLSEYSIKWHFIPPHSPNFGGLWEAAVKSAKRHFKTVMGNSCLTFEELYTTLTQIEACMNSRPLTPLTSNPDDLTPLTPAHFLIGDSLVAPPQQDFLKTPSNRLTRFERVQQLLQHFWARWSKEYLCSLQQRPRNWRITFLNPKVGSLVVIRDDNLPPLLWAMGRIVKLHVGDDGVCRVISVKTLQIVPLNGLCQKYPYCLLNELIRHYVIHRLERRQHIVRSCCFSVLIIYLINKYHIYHIYNFSLTLISNIKLKLDIRCSI